MSNGANGAEPIAVIRAQYNPFEHLAVYATPVNGDYVIRKPGSSVELHRGTLRSAQNEISRLMHDRGWCVTRDGKMSALTFVNASREDIEQAASK